MCKQRRSSEVRLAFLQKFHRKTASCCQCCLWALFALLKACESFKEKMLFCSRISAAGKNKSQLIQASDIAVCVFLHVAAGYQRFTRHRFMSVPPVLIRSTKGLTRLCAGSMLVAVEAFAIKANGTDPPPPRFPLLQLLSLLRTAGVFLDRIASFESCPTKHLIHPQPADAAGSLVLGIKPGNDAEGPLPTRSRRGTRHEHNHRSTHPAHP